MIFDVFFTVLPGSRRHVRVEAETSAQAMLDVLADPETRKVAEAVPLGHLVMSVFRIGTAVQETATGSTVERGEALALS